MSKTLQMFFGLCLFILVALWFNIISPELLKLPASISDKATLIHTENNRFDINSSWAGKTITISSSNIKTLQASGNKSNIQSLFKVESLTGETLFELDQKFVVNRLTRHNYPGEDDNEGKSSIFFPPNVSPKNINFWSVEMGAPTILEYVGNKTIEKLNTYHFSSKESVINDTPGYEFLPLVPEKYMVLSRVNIDIYVEPLTGTIIDHQDSGISFYAEKDGTPVWDIAEWSNKYNDPTILARVQEAKSKMTFYSIISRGVPIFLASLGIIFLALRYKNTKRK